MTFGEKTRDVTMTNSKETKWSNDGLKPGIHVTEGNRIRKSKKQHPFQKCRLRKKKEKNVKRPTDDGTDIH